jgi:hypothetical protein
MIFDAIGFGGVVDPELAAGEVAEVDPVELPLSVLGLPDVVVGLPALVGLLPRPAGGLPSA